METDATGPGIANDFTVGSWYVRPSINQMSDGKRTVQLEPKVMQMLVILAECAGEVVPRDELHARLWTDTIVTDKALTRLASELRKAFADDPRDPGVIATVSKNGYRLVAPVSFIGSGDGSLQAPDRRAVTMLTPTSRSRPRNHRWRYTLSAIAVTVVVVAIAILASRDLDPGFEPAVQLTSDRGHEISPSLSPDGDAVAYSWRGSADDNWDVYVRQPGSDGLLRLTNHPGDDLHPVWAPDGTRIAFVRFDSATCSINWVPALSGPVRTIAPCEWIDESDRPYRTSSIDWSPDGRTIAASDRGIVLIDVESGHQTTVTLPDETVVADVNPAFSPDGESIAFMRVRPLASSDLFYVSLEDNRVIRVTDEARLILGHDWSRNGRSLVFSSNRGGRFGLWRIPFSGGTPVSVTVDGWNIEKVSIAAAADRMAYEGWIYDTNIWRLSTRPGARPQRIIASTLWDRHPTVSPTGDRLAFVSNRSGSWELWISGVDGSGQTQVTHLGGPVVGAPQWSPDGHRIAFQVRDASDAGIYMAEIGAGVVTKVVDDRADDVAPAWSSSGDRLYFGSNRTGDWQIWETSLDGHPPVQMTRGGGYRALAGPDGTSIFVARDDTAGLWRVSIVDDVEERLLDFPEGSDWGNWSLNAQGLYVLTRRDGEQPAVELLDFTGVSRGAVLRLDRAPTPHHPGVSVSSTGDFFVTLVDATESDLFVTSLND